MPADDARKTGMDKSRILGCVLAGGKSSRMGGRDKALLDLAGQRLAARACERLADQVSRVILNSNAEPMVFADVGVPVVADSASGGGGPLAGILEAMRHARSLPGITFVATVATDTPFFPRNLVSRLAVHAITSRTIVLAASAGRIHPVAGLWPAVLGDQLAEWLGTADSFSVRRWTDEQETSVVDFPIREGLDPFFNINTPDDLTRAQALAGKFR